MFIEHMGMKSFGMSYKRDLGTRWMGHHVNVMIDLRFIETVYVNSRRGLKYHPRHRKYLEDDK